MEIQEQVNKYVSLLNGIKLTIQNESTAVAILQEIRKDARKHQSEQRRSANGNMSASEKQTQYLKSLRVEIPKGLTVRQASQLIDVAKDKNGAQEALGQPMRTT